MSNHIERIAPASLTALLDCQCKSDLLWSTEELNSILAHQLITDLEFDIQQCDDAVGVDLPSLIALATDPPIRTFGDLFEHPQPPVELLDLTRRFAKSCRSQSNCPLPPEIATILYLASISAAFVRIDQRITALDSSALLSALEWALQQDWLDLVTRDLLLSCQERLTSDCHGDL